MDNHKLLYKQTNTKSQIYRQTEHCFAVGVSVQAFQRKWFKRKVEHTKNLNEYCDILNFIINVWKKLDHLFFSNVKYVKSNSYLLMSTGIKHAMKSSFNFSDNG